jgi:hypothetical protein
MPIPFLLQDRTELTSNRSGAERASTADDAGVPRCVTSERQPEALRARRPDSHRWHVDPAAGGAVTSATSMGPPEGPPAAAVGVIAVGRLAAVRRWACTSGGRQTRGTAAAVQWITSWILPAVGSSSRWAR